MDVGLNLERTHVVVTGGAGLIGSLVVDAFLAAGAWVSSLDIAYSRSASGAGNHEEEEVSSGVHKVAMDATDEASISKAFDQAEAHFGTVSSCVCLAALDLSVLEQHGSVLDVSAERFRKTMDVNVTGTFLVAKEWLRRLERCKNSSGWKTGTVESSGPKNVGLVIVGSEAGRFGVSGSADYATSKSAVQVGLLRSLASDVPRIFKGARVNAVAPGPVDTDRFKEECKADPGQYYRESQGTVPLCRPVPPKDVAKTIVVLASENLSGSVHGQLVPIDNGKAGRVMWTESEAKQYA